jgi:hypothetical protein
MTYEATISRRDAGCSGIVAGMHIFSDVFETTIGVVTHAAFVEAMRIWHITYRIDDHDAYMYDLIYGYPHGCIIHTRMGDLEETDTLLIEKCSDETRGTSLITLPLRFNMPIDVSYVLSAFDAYLEQFSEDTTPRHVRKHYRGFRIDLSTSFFAVAHERKTTACEVVELAFMEYCYGISWILAMTPPLLHIERALLHDFEFSMFKWPRVSLSDLEKLIVDIIDYDREDMLRALYRGGMPTIDSQLSFLVQALSKCAYACARVLLEYGNDFRSSSTRKIRVMPGSVCHKKLLCDMTRPLLAIDVSVPAFSVNASDVDARARAHAESTGGHVHISIDETYLFLLGSLEHSITSDTPFDLIETCYDRALLSTDAIADLGRRLRTPALLDFYHRIADGASVDDS